MFVASLGYTENPGSLGLHSERLPSKKTDYSNLNNGSTSSQDGITENRFPMRIQNYTVTL